MASIERSPLSIYQLLRIHCRERLIVHPLLWTNRQLELLQCSFGEFSVAPPSVSRSVFAGELSGREHIGDLLRWMSQMPVREGAIENIIAQDDCPLVARFVYAFPAWWHWSLMHPLTLLPVHRRNISIHFDGRARKMRGCTTLFPRDPLNKQHPPVAVYVDLVRIDVMRGDTCYNVSRVRGHGHQASNIACSIGRLKLKKITPTEELYDPYIAGLLISLAQQQYSIWLNKPDFAGSKHTFTFSV